MTIGIVLQLLVVAMAIWIGARTGGIGLGLWGAVGLLVLSACFGVVPTAPPVDVLLIVLAVITAASVLEAAGGTEVLVGIAERVIRAHPRQVTLVAPLTTWCFTFVAGTGHVVYPLLPVIYETAHRSRVRPERPMAVAAIASQQAITASPVSAATAAMIALFSEHGLSGWGLPQILIICVPSSLAGVVAAAVVSMFVGRDLEDDPDYQARLAAGLVMPPDGGPERPTATAAGRRAVGIFLAAVGLIILLGTLPGLRTPPGAAEAVPMPVAIELVMLSAAGVMLAVTGVTPEEVTRMATLRAGVVAVVAIFGLAWLGDSFVAHNKATILPAIARWTEAAPWTFGIGLFLTSVLLYSQAATTRALMPLGLSLGIAPAQLIALFPAVNGYFLIPATGSLIAAMTFDRSGTTRIGNYLVNHSFMIPGVVATVTAVATGMLLARILF
jgi:anaerobic C4-dicarboxylate transporter DcuA